MTEERAALRQVTTRQVYESPWLRLREDTVERLDGSRGVYSVVEKRDFALIVAVEDGGFHIVEEYRYPIGRRALSFPQGGWPPGTDGGEPDDLARAELAEETGLRAGRLTRLGYLNSSHGTSTQGCHVYLAEDLTHGEPRRELEEQDQTARWVPHAELLRMIRGGEITDDSSVAAFALYLLNRPDGC